MFTAKATWIMMIKLHTCLHIYAIIIMVCCHSLHAQHPSSDSHRLHRIVCDAVYPELHVSVLPPTQGLQPKKIASLTITLLCDCTWLGISMTMREHPLHKASLKSK